MKVRIEKELDDFWGIDDLLEAFVKSSKKEKEVAILELLHEDLSAALNDAEWKILWEE